MNAPAPAATITMAAFQIAPVVLFAPSQTRTQARRRARFTTEELAELATNIKKVGIMQPIVARPIAHPSAPVNKYEIVAGERRWLAAQEAGLIEIPAIIREVADADLVTFQLTENLQRKTLDALDEAEGYDELRKAKQLSAEQVADLLGVSRSTVFNRLKLLDLAPEASTYLDEGKLHPSVALLIARLPDPKLQAKAAHGCATGKDLGDFYPEESRRNGPLSVADAEEYIKEQFTTRLEGTAAINRAKAEGKPVVAGKEAAEAWKRHWGGPAGYVQLGEQYWTGNGRKTYAATLGDNPPGVVLIQSPHTGAAVKCLPREDAIRIFKEKKATLPSELAPRPPHSPAAQATARTREELKRQREADIRFAIFKAMRAKCPAKLGKPELLDLLEFLEDETGYIDEVRELAPRPKSLAACTERDLVRFVLDDVYGGAIAEHHRWGDNKKFLAAAKRYGVNAERIRKELTAKAEDAADTARMKAKLAKVSPLVKTKKGKGKKK